MSKTAFKRNLVTLALIGASLSLSGCNDNVSLGVWVDATAALAKKDYSAVTYNDILKQTYRTGSSHPYSATPSKGEVNLLVIPVEFDGYPFVNETKSIDRIKDINTLFNGTDEETNYWKSLSGFYDESSFHSLKLKATIAETYKMNMAPESFLQVPNESGKSLDGTSAVVALMRKCVDSYKTAHGADSTKQFDSDGDGVIDGIYLVYSFYDYQVAKKLSISANESYWAFTTYDNTASSVESPVGGNFMWASFDFMYTGVKEGVGVDSHTFCHETGHMLGLADYYNYDDINDNEKVDPKYRHFTPTGALDMMDYNILDHDIWSKFALGWAKPYVVDSSLSFPLTVTLGDSVSSNGDFIIIPDSSSVYNGTAFGEYLVLELYSPTGLNKLDSLASYSGTRPKGFRSAGLKISHVDSRLARISAGVGTYDDAPTKEKLAASTSAGYYNVVASNTPSSSSDNPGYRLNHLLESNGVLTFDNYDPEKNTNYANVSYANDSTLFSGSTGHNRFSMKAFASFYENGEKFNNGHAFGYALRVNRIKKASDGSYSVSLTIDKE